MNIICFYVILWICIGYYLLGRNVLYIYLCLYVCVMHPCMCEGYKLYFYYNESSWLIFYKIQATQCSNFMPKSRVVHPPKPHDIIDCTRLNPQSIRANRRSMASAWLQKSKMASWVVGLLCKTAPNRFDCQNPLSA